MKRYVNLEDISDGRLYGENDMVKADCHGCQGCSACCRGMGNSIILDPYDIYRLQQGRGFILQELLAKGAVELQVVDGIILPNLAMVGEEERCSFLNEEGRCSIHESRPGICRLFPLGRYYEKDDFKYFLQVGECTAPHSKVKVNKWMDTPAMPRYHQFILQWHNLLKREEAFVNENLFADTEDQDNSTSQEVCKKRNMKLLETFYLTPYEDTDFYEQYESRLRKFEEALTE